MKAEEVIARLEKVLRASAVARSERTAQSAMELEEERQEDELFKATCLIDDIVFEIEDIDQAKRLLVVVQDFMAKESK